MRNLILNGISNVENSRPKQRIEFVNDTCRHGNAFSLRHNSSQYFLVWTPPIMRLSNPDNSLPKTRSKTNARSQTGAYYYIEIEQKLC